MADRIPDITDDATFFRSTRLSIAISLISSPTLKSYLHSSQLKRRRDGLSGFNQGGHSARSLLRKSLRNGTSHRTTVNC